MIPDRIPVSPTPTVMSRTISSARPSAVRASMSRGCDTGVYHPHPMTMFRPVTVDTRRSACGSRPIPMFVVSTIVRPPADRNACASRTASASSSSARSLKLTPSRARLRRSSVIGCPQMATCDAGVPGPGPLDPPPRKRCSCISVTPRLSGATGPVTVIAMPEASWGTVMVSSPIVVPAEAGTSTPLRSVGATLVVALGVPGPTSPLRERAPLCGV